MEMNPVIAAEASAAERADFIRKTYAHLLGAVAAFIGIEAALINSPLAEPMVRTMLSGNWLIVLGAFMLVSWVADKWARSGTSQAMQYLGLGVYVVAEAIIMLPLLYVAAFYAKDPNIIPMAGIFTGLLFTGLTATVFINKSDFSWMRPMLTIAGLAAIGVVVVSTLFGFTLGTFFTAAMILLAAGYVLYSTSNVLHHYPVGSHVAASLSLFAAVALMFWYILRLLMSMRR
jgi:FtsH-binding integral membrane protein